jgi:hypothetical protein
MSREEVELNMGLIQANLLILMILRLALFWPGLLIS